MFWGQEEEVDKVLQCHLKQGAESDKERNREVAWRTEVLQETSSSKTHMDQTLIKSITS